MKGKKGLDFLFLFMLFTSILLAIKVLFLSFTMINYSSTCRMVLFFFFFSHHLQQCITQFEEFTAAVFTLFGSTDSNLSTKFRPQVENSKPYFADITLLDASMKQFMKAISHLNYANIALLKV